MNTLTLTGIRDELHHKLVERAAANHRSIEEEAECCLQISLFSDELPEAALPESRWREIEESLIEGVKAPATEFTAENWDRFRDYACGQTHQKNL